MVPDPSTPIAVIGLPPASERVSEAFSRMVVFLHGVMQADTKVRAILAGYDRSTHATGVYLAEHLAGQRTFFEWRIQYSLRPPRDPDLPEQIAELEAFVDRWKPIAARAVATPTDELDREELQALLQEPLVLPSRVWRAKQWIQCLESLGTVPVEFYQVAWAELVRAGVEEELSHVREVLKVVQEFIRNAPLEAPEREDLALAREATADVALAWLRDRRQQLATKLGPETCTVLGLGDLVPPQPPEVPIREVLAWSGMEN